MAKANGKLGAVYGLGHGEDLRRHYDDWADRYEAELTANGYCTPARCAEALALHLPDRAAWVLDFACGTGLAGRALHAAGFTCIDGIDLSAGMLARAAESGIYRELHLAEIGQPANLRARGYTAIVGAGAIGAGAAPAQTIDRLIDSLTPGALFVFSLNDKALIDPDYAERPAQAARAGDIEILQAEDGPHLPALGLGARVFVLRRL